MYFDVVIILALHHKSNVVGLLQDLRTLDVALCYPVISGEMGDIHDAVIVIPISWILKGNSYFFAPLTRYSSTIFVKANTTPSLLD